jgi:hypothetical protein
MKVLVFLLLLSSVLSPLKSRAQPASKKTIIKYKDHTQLDFTGQKVEGQIRSPQVFYIFQRKRNIGPQIVELPNTLDAERKSTQLILEHKL